MVTIGSQIRTRKVSTLVSTWARTFDPRMFAGLQLWFDAADASTITESSGAVSQWNDKSGNTYNVTQGTAGARPTTGTTTLNGLNVISFDGGDGLNRIASSVLGQNVSGLTMYAVHTVNAFPGVGGVGEVLRITRGTSRDTRCIFRAVNGDMMQTGGRTLDGDSFPTVSSSVIPTGKPLIQVGVFDYANLRCKQYINGVLDGVIDPFNTATTTSNTASQAIGVGNNTFGTNAYNGTIGELLVFHATHNEPEIRAIESYLNAKWAVF